MSCLGNKYSNIIHHLFIFPFSYDIDLVTLNLRRWSQISRHFPGRTDNEIKNRWHSYLKKKVGKQTDSSLESSEAYGCRKLPKILFADWLSHDQFHNFGTSSHSLVSTGACHYAFGSQTTVMNNIQEGSSYSFADSMDLLQLEYVHQHM